MEGPIEEPFQEVKKRGPGRPRKVPLAPVPEAAAPVPEPLPPVPEAAPEPEHSLRDVMERLEDMEKRLTPKPVKPRVRVKPPPLPEPAAQPVQVPEQSGMGYLNSRRAHRTTYHSFMPP
jgi:hypothetical protein